MRRLAAADQKLELLLAVEAVVFVKWHEIRFSDFKLQISDLPLTLLPIISLKTES
jgi:hypothetical protein